MKVKRMTNKELKHNIIVSNVCSIIIIIIAVVVVITSIGMIIDGSYYYGLIGILMGIVMKISAMIILLFRDNSKIMLEMRRKDV